MPKYLINKAFIELRYKDSLLFNDMRCLQEIANDLSDLFINYNYDQNNKVLIMVNDNKNLKATIQNNRLVIDQDEVESLDEFKRVAVRCLKTVLLKLCIPTVIRAGMRTLRGIEVKNIREASNFIRKNFIKVNDNELGILGENYEARVGFSTRYENYDISLTINPNLFQVINIKDGKVLRNLEIPQILVDTDVFVEDNVETNKIIEKFIEDVLYCNCDIVDKFVGKVSIY